MDCEIDGVCRARIQPEVRENTEIVSRAIQEPLPPEEGGSSIIETMLEECDINPYFTVRFLVVSLMASRSASRFSSVLVLVSPLSRLQCRSAERTHSSW